MDNCQKCGYPLASNQCDNGCQMPLAPYVQVGIRQLQESVRSSSDPLEIVNAFNLIPDNSVPMMHPYWLKRLCAMAEFITGSRKQDTLGNAWQFAVRWYSENEIANSIQRSRKLLSERSERIPEDIYSPAFAAWLTDQYRLAMAKGIQLGRGQD